MSSDPSRLIWRIGSLATAPADRAERTRIALRLAADYAVIAEGHDDPAVLEQQACRVASQGLQAPFTRLLVYDGASQDFLVAAGIGCQTGIVGARTAADIGTAALRAWQTGKSVVGGANGDGRSRTAVSAGTTVILSQVGIPVPGEDGHAYAILEVQSPRSGDFTAADVSFLQLLAHSLGNARRRVARWPAGASDADAMPVQHDAVREFQHRVCNDLQGICFSIEREIRQLGDGERRGGFDRVSRQVFAIGELYEQLRQLPSGRAVQLDTYLDALCRKIAAAAALPLRGIAIRVELQPVRLIVQCASAVAIAVNELIANAAEHAFIDGHGGVVTVRLLARDEATGDLVVIVSDDGCGIAPSRPAGAGLGFVDRLVRSIGGRLTRMGGAGTTWRVDLPART